MKATVYKCDSCGREKQQANHWYVLDEVNDIVQICRWEDSFTGQHFCGTECLFKRLTQWAQ